ncbi:MAG TPA: hypothetical protein VI814_10860 [Candidatus Limnocylindria bacterium]
MKLSRLGAAYEREIRGSGRERRFLAAIAFLVTWLAARVATHVLLAERGGGGLQIGSLHVHHVVFGLVLLLAAGELDVLGLLPRTRAILFGVGAALALDEFALILNLADVYWQPQGRESIDAVVIFAAVAWILTLGRGFWRAVKDELLRVVRRSA